MNPTGSTVAMNLAKKLYEAGIRDSAVLQAIANTQENCFSTRHWRIRPMKTPPCQ